MISVQEAHELISGYYPKDRSVQLLLNEAAGSVLAEDIYSPVDTPPFHQSAMDGYAFSFDTWNGKDKMKVSGEIPAGTFFEEELKPGQAVRIFTGSCLPKGADTVIVVEKIVSENDSILLNDENLKKGDNVRRQGTQTIKGEKLLSKGHYLSPASISFLAGTGIEKVTVYTKPVISIIVTGKELVQPGQSLPPGSIYESNSFGLIAALQKLSISPASVERIDDNITDLKSSISKQLHSDILILTGGVSMGNYDLVPEALEACGVKMVFHKVKQKPGKPFYFGISNPALVFALPGNPAAVLSCFYEYIVPAISSFTKKSYLMRAVLPLANDYSKRRGLTFFLKGKINAESVSILEDQESYKMNSFAIADCLVELEEGKEQFYKGAIVNVLKIV